MKAKRTRDAVSTPLPLAEVSGSDRDLLTNAYKTGLILGWRLDRERGYRLTLGDRRDEYVEIAKLTSQLERLRKAAS